MNELVFRGENGDPMTTSQLVADTFGKRHDHVIRDIETTINYIQSVDTQHIPNLGNCDTMFVEQIIEVPVFNGGTRKTKSYIMNRDAFTLLAMGYTGKKAMEFKLKYIAAFNTMERIIRENLQLPQAQPAVQSNLSADVSELRERVARLEKLLGTKNSSMEIPSSTTHTEEYPWESVIKTYRNLRLRHPKHISVIQAARLLTLRGVCIRHTTLFRFLRENGLISAANATYHRPSAECVKKGWMVCIYGRSSADYPGRRYHTPYLSPEFVDILERRLSAHSVKALDLWKGVAE